QAGPGDHVQGREHRRGRETRAAAARVGAGRADGWAAGLRNPPTLVNNLRKASADHVLSTAISGSTDTAGCQETVSKRNVNSGVKSMASPRRTGSPEAKNRAALLDAAEQIMLEEGYPRPAPTDRLAPPDVGGD